MRVKLSDIVRDTSIQCRASVDIVTVNAYAESMGEGDEFPPVDLFTDGERFWIGDGWHRIMAADMIGAKHIEADVSEGGRAAALKAALKANAVHGLRRTNADKRRCVEVALQEFGGLSSRAIAEMCGVSNHMVDEIRPKAMGENPNAQTRLTADGRQYPARKPTRQATPSASVFQSQQPSRAPAAHERASSPAPSTPEHTFLPQQPQHEQKEVHRIRDPLDTTKDVPDGDIPEDNDSENLYHLKRYWRLASKKDKKEFERWINANNG